MPSASRGYSDDSPSPRSGEGREHDCRDTPPNPPRFAGEGEPIKETHNERHRNLPNRAKKGVGLSGVTAGNTALCTVGRTGNDLHYRGYDILDVAETCEFEEIAYLLVHGTLPTRAELRRLQGEAPFAARPARPR